MTARGVDFTGIAYLVAIGVVGFVAYELVVNRKTLANLVNPASPDNVANRAANSIVQSVTGDKNQTLGGAVYDFFHRDAGLATNETRNADGTIRQKTWEEQLRDAGGIDESGAYMVGVGGA